MTDWLTAAYAIIGLLIAVCAIPPEKSRLTGTDYIVTAGVIIIWPVFLVYSLTKAVKGWR